MLTSEGADAQQPLKRVAALTCYWQLIAAALRVVAGIENNQPAVFHVSVDARDGRVWQGFSSFDHGPVEDRIILNIFIFFICLMSKTKNKCKKTNF